MTPTDATPSTLPELPLGLVPLLVSRQTAAVMLGKNETAVSSIDRMIALNLIEAVGDGANTKITYASLVKYVASLPRRHHKFKYKQLATGSMADSFKAKPKRQRAVSKSEG